MALTFGCWLFLLKQRQVLPIKVSSSEREQPPVGSETPLAGLVRRAGGDPSMLRLDSLQGTVLAEFIRKEQRRWETLG